MLLHKVDNQTMDKWVPLLHDKIYWYENRSAERASALPNSVAKTPDPPKVG